jgi:hypothetical protein
MLVNRESLLSAAGEKCVLIVFARLVKSLNGVSSKMRWALAPSGMVESSFCRGSILHVHISMGRH